METGIKGEKNGRHADSKDRGKERGKERGKGDKERDRGSEPTDYRIITHSMEFDAWAQRKVEP